MGYFYSLQVVIFYKYPGICFRTDFAKKLRVDSLDKTKYRTAEHASAKKRFTSGGRNPRPDGLRPPYASRAP